MKEKFILLSILLASILDVLAQNEIKSFCINDSVEIFLEQTLFDKNSKIFLNKEGHTILINDELVYGTDGLNPTNKLSSAILNINGLNINLETTGMFDPFLNMINKEDIVFKQNYSGYVIRISFSVGAGSYIAEWIIILNKSFLTIVTSNQKSFPYFMQKIPNGWDPEP